MRTAWGGLVALLVGACGGTVPHPAGSSTTAKVDAQPAPVREPKRVEAAMPWVDPIQILAAPDAEAEAGTRWSWLVPGRIQLEIGSAFIEGPGGNEPMRVTLFARSGTLARVAVNLPNVRFSVWSEASRLLGVIQDDVQVDFKTYMRPDLDFGTTLHRGAAVQRLAHEEHRTKIRYAGAMEVEGWVPDEELGDSIEAGDRYGNRRWGQRTEMVMYGAAVRAEQQWASTVLATVSRGYMLTVMDEISDDWLEVAFDDADVSVHGYYGRHEPPNAVHPTRSPPVPPATVVTNVTVPSGTCLYASVDGDPIGYVVEDQPVDLQSSATTGWVAITIDTPWGPIAFTGKGTSANDVAACAPDGAVPTSRLKGTSTP